jgi:hypothetical protein
MTKKELLEKKVEELRAIASKLGITLKGKRKDEIVEEIQKAARRAARKAPPGAAKRPPAKPAREAAPSVLSLTKKELETKKVDELRAIAGKLGIVLRAGRKDEIIAQIQKAAKKAKGVVSKPPVKAAAKAPPVSGVPEARARAEEKPAARVRKAPPRRHRPGAHYVEGAVPPGAPGPVQYAHQHGEVDMVTAIVVDPWQIFVSWELTGETARLGPPALRIYDSTGAEGAGEEDLGFFDFLLYSSVGNAYFDVMPGRELLVVLGIMATGRRFVPVKKAGRLLIPNERAAEGRALLPEEFFEFRPTGY